MTKETGETTRTAADAGWQVSRYNLISRIQDTDKVVIANLFRGTCAVYSSAELFLLNELKTLDEYHPILDRFKKRGLIVNFDELEALKVLGRGVCAGMRTVSLTICPTMGCNFDCPYCFENHFPGVMTESVQDDVAGLAGRMLDEVGAEKLLVIWFGGEPLLAVDVIARLSERLMALAGEKGAKYEAEIITNGYLLTQSTADLLCRCKVTKAQITLDGLGAVHDKTRHLAGGGSTFARITDNLRHLNLPFEVKVRHNVHEGNRDEMVPLKSFVENLARESGNRISYYPAPVFSNHTADARSENVLLLCGADSGDVLVSKDAMAFAHGRGHYCTAHLLFSLGIDAQGRLHKCWEEVDKPEHSFGTAACWDPFDLFATADAPDNLIRYLNTAMPFDDARCLACIWLPVCAGGCPKRRLYDGGRCCLPYRDDPGKYVMALYERLQKQVMEKADEE